MLINGARTIGGALLTVLITGGLALTAASASADTADTAVMTAEQGDRLRGPWLVTNDNFQATTPTSAWRSVNEFLTVNDYADYVDGSEPWDRETYLSWAEMATFPAVGTTGPVMLGDQCITQTGTTKPYRVDLLSCNPGSATQQFVTNSDGTISYPQEPGTYLQVDTNFTPTPRLVISAEGGMYLERIDFTTLVPVAATDCAEGLNLTGWIKDLVQREEFTVLSGTGAPGATITVSSRIRPPKTPESWPFTTVVDANGDWTVTVTDLWSSVNYFRVESSDNCSPVDLQVYVILLNVPIMHPAAAWGTAVLGLAAFGFELRRRAKQHLIAPTHGNAKSPSS